MQTGETTIRARRGHVRRLTGGAGPKRLGRGGFTLTEIMIAMGVLAVGMAMVAGALHAGIQIHIRTIDDIMRQLIGDNSLATVQARVRHSPTNGITDTYQLLNNTYLGAGDLKYPCDPKNNNPSTPYGAAVFMKLRKIDANSFNDYDVLIVPYRVVSNSATLPTVEAKEMTPCVITAGTYGSNVAVPAGSANILKAGSVIIDSRNGQVTFVRSTPTTSTAELTSTLTAGVGNSVKLITLTLKAPVAATDRLECSKPIQTKTALSPDPAWKPV
jgi:prepilin-type N-terminal cleavage/methylation domain-containing protein